MDVPIAVHLFYTNADVIKFNIKINKSKGDLFFATAFDKVLLKGPYTGEKVLQKVVSMPIKEKWGFYDEINLKINMNAKEESNFIGVKKIRNDFLVYSTMDGNVPTTYGGSHIIVFTVPTKLNPKYTNQS